MRSLGYGYGVLPALLDSTTAEGRILVPATIERVASVAVSARLCHQDRGVLLAQGDDACVTGARAAALVAGLSGEVTVQVREKLPAASGNRNAALARASAHGVLRASVAAGLIDPVDLDALRAQADRAVGAAIGECVPGSHLPCAVTDGQDILVPLPRLALLVAGPRDQLFGSHHTAERQYHSRAISGLGTASLTHTSSALHEILRNCSSEVMDTVGDILPTLSNSLNNLHSSGAALVHADTSGLLVSFSTLNSSSRSKSMQAARTLTRFLPEGWVCGVTVTRASKQLTEYQ